MRCQRGFTLIELLVVVVVIGLLAAIALPNFVGARQKAKLAQVKSNMHLVHVAACAYATDQSGIFPSTAPELASYYPGGSNMSGGGTGTFPLNPITPGTNDLPIDGTPLTSVVTSRTQPPGTITGNMGQVYYCQVTGSQNLSFGVVGMDDRGGSLAGNNGTQMVLSNQ